MDCISCHLCGKLAQLQYKNHCGYQLGSFFDLYHCDHCNTAFADPLEVDEHVYDLIYGLAEKIQGYDRYLDYAKKVLLSRDPLEFLAESEEMYWAVKQVLEKKSTKKGKILEIGSGLGYLTYALSKKGYDVLGVDISERAVNSAKKRYGDFFQCADIHSFGDGRRYETIILTEVIEHITDIKSFMKAVDRLVADNGEIIITTPNKSAYRPDVLWETEPPPVHLWWFSEQSMRHLATELHYDVEFVDFTAYNQKYRQTLVDTPHIPTRSPRLTANGKIHYNSWKTYLKRQMVIRFRQLGLLPMMRTIQQKLGSKQGQPSQRSATLCALFKKTSPHK